ncbi:MAG: hypothetical protein KGZ83_12895 [Sulfuricella sp.]|nr:hypothetical protein [Sulfuricella sp.]
MHHKLVGALAKQSVHGGIVNHPCFGPPSTPTAAIYAKLARLQQLANDHFDHAPDAIKD